ncbi:MAG: tetratricopeptide repeat protein [Rhodospirillales bacterium]|nr:tetratricopeptide repeat protein [Rhodospirillales bacterium]
MNRKERRKLAKQAGRSPAQDRAVALMAEGMALVQAGRPAQAIPVYENAAKHDSRNTDAHYVLGVLYKQSGAPEQAIAHYRQAIAIAPAHVNACYNLGNLLAAQNQLDEAIAAYRQAVRFDPKMAMAWNNLGNLLNTRGDLAEAEKAYAQAILAAPDNVDALFNLGEIQRGSGRQSEAVATFEAALALDPDHVASLNNLGATLRELKNHGQSAARLRRVLELAPDLVMGHVNLGNTLRDLGDYEPAMTCFETALKLQPDNARAHTNFGNLLDEMGRFAEAGQQFAQALTCDPVFPEGHYNLGLFELREGHYASGWAHFDRRWGLDGFRGGVPDFEKPQWQGEALAGKTLLLWDEQGVGDTILFTGMVADLLKQNCHLKLQCDPRLIPLISRAYPAIECAAKGAGNRVRDDAEDFDFHAPLGNLGRLLRPTAEAFPAVPRYLAADPETTATLRKRYQQSPEDLLVGIAWHSKGPDSGPRKSMTLKDLQPVLEIPGITFVDLQYGDTEAERRAFAAETGINIVHDDAVDQLRDIDLFAAQTAAMDYVVTISNTTAHMAGSLGVPSLVMLCQVPTWYWMLERADSPWYPSLHLFRQAQAPSWDDVIDAVAAALKGRIAAV